MKILNKIPVEVDLQTGGIYNFENKYKQSTRHFFNSGAEIVSSPQGSKFGASETIIHSDQQEGNVATNESTEENIAEREEVVGEHSENAPDASKSGGSGNSGLATEEDMENGEEEFTEEAAAGEVPENADSESEFRTRTTLNIYSYF